MKPHKHAELIKAWADGAEIESQRNDGTWVIVNPAWSEQCEYRIKPPQWQEDLRQAVRNGKTIEIKHGDWMWSSINENVDTYLFGVFTEDRYRIKPEPKPDVVRYLCISLNEGASCISRMADETDNLKIIFDGETGEPKSAEVLK